MNSSWDAKMKAAKQGFNLMGEGKKNLNNFKIMKNIKY